MNSYEKPGCSELKCAYTSVKIEWYKMLKLIAVKYVQNNCIERNVE